MTRYIATIDSGGQVTIPPAIRRRRGVRAADKIAFVVTDRGTVELHAVRFTLESVLGSIPALSDESADLDREIAEAIEAAAKRDELRP